MIDIVTDQGRNLKNIRQIGTPSEEDRIYIDHVAYARIHEEDYEEKRVFLFMGHTECEDGCYITFIEAAIPVRNVSFEQNVPKWSNQSWSDAFREIKRSYENSIIVGWAFDRKGFRPRMTEELESIHREQFGGLHQVLFLMDSLEGEESFFLNKKNHMQASEGFYIYYTPKLRELKTAQVTFETPDEVQAHVKRRGEHTAHENAATYKGNVGEDDILAELKAENEKENEHTSGESQGFRFAVGTAVAILAVVIGMGAYQGRISVDGVVNAVAAMADITREKTPQTDVLVGTEWTENTEVSEEIMNLTPIKPAKEVDTEQSRDTEERSTENVQQNTQDMGDVDVVATLDEQKAVEDTLPEYYLVQEGDTLTSICMKIYGDSAELKELAETNKLDDSDDIHIGQKLILP